MFLKSSVVRSVSSIFKLRVDPVHSLLQRIALMPQVNIGHFPTPLEECPRLSEALDGPRIFMKREDCAGLAFGGSDSTHKLKHGASAS